MRQILIVYWDPIGIYERDRPWNDEHEYDGYASSIVDMIKSGSDIKDIIRYLEWASVENMGLDLFDEMKTIDTANRIQRLNE